MARTVLPLKEVSIDELFISGEKSVYEIPIYQRNYAWEKDEITTLIQDVYDAFKKNNQKVYYIGTLVSYHKGDRVFEIIDGQQRLTTIRLILGALDIVPENKLTYRARKKSDATLRSIPTFEVDEKDIGIENGFRHAENAISEIVPTEEKEEFSSYFTDNVHIIHYQVPKDIDLNHYFEIMNSRGEQLEKHEIVKAKLMETLHNDKERKLFNYIWESCSELSVYVQQQLKGLATESVFSKSLCDFQPNSFEDLMNQISSEEDSESDRSISINEILSEEAKKWVTIDEGSDRKDSFQPIIDFPNFLLIVLKITRMNEDDFLPKEFNLDDKELLNEFDNANMQAKDVKAFAFNLLKARCLLDNYVVHHSKEDDTLESNPWKLQVWYKDEDTKKGQLKNLCDDQHVQDQLVHLLSMFEVSFTARQRKNYLFYCLMYLIKQESRDTNNYVKFVEDLAKRYFNEVYLDQSKLNSINTPLPGGFDEVMLDGKELSNNPLHSYDDTRFVSIYGDGTEVSKGVPLFIFNYLDYRLWKLYDDELRGERSKEGSKERKEFFETLGCGDFGLKVFDQFYFSRTRRSLEHYYPQAMATGENGFLDQKQINCIGNYAMIGSEANSSGSNWSPKTKLDHYLDSSGKISKISVASLKFMIMMKLCRDKQKWEFEEIKEHQKKMIDVLMNT